ncbi:MULTISPECIES: sigma-70 family RNA polymerase sigma factor [Ensifer]|uniref:Sigma-70 family RNA polymerase sigma factor n=1 Tax=Ensifer adhaerens TaxID=106592 RepID=A0ABY8HTQ9_ENSAD|nr:MULTISPECIES: sigma-70 family RNA polymerase sigma factor [Ensifer]WFP95517.1 sigma-70 family RNA polymerase sigma factor [Ensifer adhaerens]
MALDDKVIAKVFHQFVPVIRIACRDRHKRGQDLAVGHQLQFKRFHREPRFPFEQPSRSSCRHIHDTKQKQAQGTLVPGRRCLKTQGNLIVGHALTNIEIRQPRKAATMPSIPVLDDQTRPLETQVVDLIPALRAFARTFVSSSFEADDLLQETLFRALRGIDGFQPGTNLKSWLFTIMHNAFRTQYKLRKREAPGAVNCADLPIPIPAPQDWCVLNGELRTALEGLAPDHREVLVLVAGYGLSYKEAADMCDCAIGTIKSRLSRARDELAYRMNGVPLE